MINLKLRCLIGVVVFVGTTTFAFAETGAPVYDADSYSPQTESQVDASVDPEPQSGGAVSQGYASSPSSGSSSQQKIARLEQQINNLQNSNSAAKVNALQAEVQSLRGQVEDLTHQVEQLQAQVRTGYADLDKRLARSSSETKPNMTNSDPTDTPAASNDKVNSKKTADTSTKQTSQPNVAEEQQIYQTAYNYIKAKKYNEAVAALQSMLQKYPSGQFAANAHYWLGELYGLMNKNDQSAAEFSAVIKNYPESPKISDAQLKLGLIYASKLNWSEAKAAFKTVINKYPGSTSARVAAEQLKQIKSAGH